MNRITESLLAVIALALIAADAPTVPKRVTPDNSANATEIGGGAATGVSAVPRDVRDDPKAVAALERAGILLVPNANGNVVRVRDVAIRRLVDPADWMPHLKGLPALWSLSFQWHMRTTDAHMALLKDLTGLRELRIEQSQVSDAGLANLEGLRNLVVLSLGYDKKITDAGLAHLRGLTKIRDLDLSRTGISDSGLRELKDMQVLQTLDIAGTRITDDGLVHLKGLRMLRTLRCGQTKITTAGELGFREACLWVHWRLAFAPGVDPRNGPEDDKPAPSAEAKSDSPPKAQAVGGAFPGALDETEATTSLDRLACLSRLDGHVDKVFIIGTVDPAKLAPHLKRLPTLRALWLPGRATDSYMTLVKDLPGLKDLTVCYGDVTDTGLANLEGAGGLLRLDLRGSREFTSAGLAHLSRLTKLSRLCLAQTRVDDTGLENLKGLNALEFLDLSDTEVAGRGLGNLKELKALQSLDLSKTKVVDRTLEYVSRLRQLKQLRLSSTGITDAGLVHLMGMRNLRGLVCAGTKVTKAGVKPLIERYPQIGVTIGDGTNLSATSYIQAKGPDVEAAGGNPAATADEREAIAMLRRRGSKVRWNRDGSVYSVVIAPGVYPAVLLPYLKCLPRLRELELWLATDSQMVLVKGLPRLSSLKARSGGVTDAGLANLEGAADLVKLDLCGEMQVTGAGLAHLRQLTKMTHLNLAYTGVDDAGLKNLTELNELRWLDVSNTKVTGAGLKNLTEMKELLWLNVSNTKVTGPGLQYLAHLRNLQPWNIIGVPRDGLLYMGTAREFYRLGCDGSEATQRGVRPSSDSHGTRKIIVSDGEGILGAHVIEEPVLKAADKEKGAKPSPKPGKP